MDDKGNNYGIGYTIGREAAARLEEHAAGYCACERRRIELTNEPGVRALRGKIAILKDGANDIERRIPYATLPGEARSRRRKAIFYGSIAVLLCIAGFAFAIITFQPFRLGWISWLYCTGIAVVTPFLVDQTLDSWANTNVSKVVCTAACVAALVGGVLLAGIRGDLLFRMLGREEPVLSLDADDASRSTETRASSPQAEAASASAPQSSTQNEGTFYDRTRGALRLAMALFALTIEVGAGLALREARCLSSSGEDREMLQNQLAGVRGEMVETGYALWQLENEGAIFEKAFWRDFYSSLLTKTVNGAVRKLTAVLLAFLFLATARLRAADCLNLVILPDLSRSVATADASNRAEFHKNLDGVKNVLAHLPAGSDVAVFGITDDSFSKPYPLLVARLSTDEGYFKERLEAGRAQLLRLWEARSQHLQPQFERTDILGALQLASQRFRREQACRKMLILFSDMRQDTDTLKLERSDQNDIARCISELSVSGLIPDLHDVEVHALGVDAGQITVMQWQVIKKFWQEVFRNAGAHVAMYSVFRSSPF
jgi:hypothetical protein